MISTSNRESHKETNTLPKIDVPYPGRVSRWVSLPSVTNKRSSCLLPSTPTHASCSWFTRQHYRVPLKGCSTPNFQNLQQDWGTLGDPSKLAHNLGDEGDVGNSKSIREKWKPTLCLTGGPASFSLSPKASSTRQLLEAPWEAIL